MIIQVNNKIVMGKSKSYVLTSFAKVSIEPPPFKDGPIT